MEQTPIFAALVAPPAGGRADLAPHDGRVGQRRTVPEILRALRAEQDQGQVPAPATTRDRVGRVPGVLSFRPSPRV